MVTAAAASAPIFIAVATSGTPNLTITESVSPYTTCALLGDPPATVNSFSTVAFVSAIIVRPYAVTDAEMARQGSCPTVAPVNPYTELAEIFSASCRPFCTATTNGSVALAMSCLARLRALSSSSKIVGSTPFFTAAFTK